MQKAKRTTWLQAGLLVLFLAMLVAGLARGESADVLRKSIAICLECIGIG